MNRTFGELLSRQSSFKTSKHFDRSEWGSRKVCLAEPKLSWASVDLVAVFRCFKSRLKKLWFTKSLAHFIRPTQRPDVYGLTSLGTSLLFICMNDTPSFGLGCVGLSWEIHFGFLNSIQRNPCQNERCHLLIYAKIDFHGIGLGYFIWVSRK